MADGQLQADIHI